MRTYHVGLISTSKKISADQLSLVAAALSKQMLRDVSPLWNFNATVSAFPSGKVPVGYYKMTVADNIHEPGAAGYHTDDTHQPYSLIQYDTDWSVTCSHELIEMIGDPWGNRLYPGVINNKRVQVLQELCDPCEAFSYAIDGVSVSDFLLPAYYDAAVVSGKHYSFLNKLTKPYVVADGGYISWLDPSNNHWYQETNFGQIVVSDLGLNSELIKGFKSLREAVDAHSLKNHTTLGKLKPKVESFQGPF